MIDFRTKTYLYYTSILVRKSILIWSDSSDYSVQKNVVLNDSAYNWECRYLIVSLVQLLMIHVIENWTGFRKYFSACVDMPVDLVDNSETKNRTKKLMNAKALIRLMSRLTGLWSTDGKYAEPASMWPPPAVVTKRPRNPIHPTIKPAGTHTKIFSKSY